MSITSTTKSYEGGLLKLGNVSSDVVSFYGATGSAKQTLPTFTVTTGAVSTTTGAITSWGFSTSTQANTLTVAVSEILTILTNLGIVA